MKRMRPPFYSLQIKLITLVLGILIFILSTWSWLTIKTERELLIAQMQRRAHTISRIFALSNIEAMLSHDYPVVQTNVEMVATQDPEIVGLKVIQEEKQVASYQRPDLENQKNGGKTIQVLDNINYRNLNLGKIEVVFSTEQAMQRVRGRTLMMAVMAVSSFFILAFLLIWILKKIILTPIHRMTEFARQIGQGSLEGRIEVRSQDEMGELSRSMNQMVQGLQVAQKRLIEQERLKQERNDLEKMNQALREAEAELVQSEKMAALGELLAGLGHELNNPLNFIYANLEPLRERIALLQKMHWNQPQSGVEGEAPRALPVEGATLAPLNDLMQIAKDMEEGAVRAKAILEDFRFFSHPSHGRNENVSFPDLMDHSLRLLGLKWQHRIEIKKDYDSSLKVKGSATELGQLFVNLLSNACDAIIEKGLICIRAREKSGQIEVQIQDSGVGISADRIKKIFDPFYTTKAPGKGTGLGLAIVSQIIKKHQGSIEVQSSLGEGTEFVVRLPL